MLVADVLGVGDGDGVIGERGAANRTQSLVPHHELVVNFQALADGEKRLPLALLGTLPVTDVDRGRVVVAHRQRGADAGIHASAEEDDGAGLALRLASKKLLIADC